MNVLSLRRLNVMDAANETSFLHHNTLAVCPGRDGQGAALSGAAKEH
jgi:hypothetical protein